MTLPDFLTEWPYGEIVLTGRRIGLFHVLDRGEQGDSPEAIAELFELTPERVHDVLAFARSHPTEVAAYMADYRAELARQEAAWQPTPAYLRIRRLMDRDPAGPAENARHMPVRFLLDEHLRGKPLWHA
jgi:uncharacterized protein (DUF433 family)